MNISKIAGFGMTLLFATLLLGCDKSYCDYNYNAYDRIARIASCTAQKIGGQIQTFESHEQEKLYWTTKGGGNGYFMTSTRENIGLVTIIICKDQQKYKLLVNGFGYNPPLVLKKELMPESCN